MLPDILAPSLGIVFVGINPGQYSDRVGHYFARKQNQFWPALHRSGLVPIPLTPEDDYRMPLFGCGLTDMVKRTTPSAGEVARAEFIEGAKKLRAKLEPLEPRIICFVGLQGYRHGLDRHAVLGVQSLRWGKSHLFIVPSTSPRNVYYRNEIDKWYRSLKTHLDTLKGAELC